jgi:hypothetical protein
MENSTPPLIVDVLNLYRQSLVQSRISNASLLRYSNVHLADDDMADAAPSVIRALDLKSGIKLKLSLGAGIALLLSLRAWSW